MYKMTYTHPTVEVLDIAVEKGFASSGNGLSSQTEDYTEGEVQNAD